MYWGNGPKWRAQRTYRGWIQAAAGLPNPYTITLLWNSSVGPLVLVVRDFYVECETNVVPFSYLTNVVQGTVGTNVNPIYPGQPAPAGQLYQGSISTIPSRDYRGNNDTTDQHFWVHDFPYAIIPPGWGLGWFSGTNSTNPQDLSIYWSEVPVEHALMVDADEFPEGL